MKGRCRVRRGRRDLRGTLRRRVGRRWIWGCWRGEWKIRVGEEGVEPGGEMGVKRCMEDELWVEMVCGGTYKIFMRLRRCSK